jgi:hypothetical protein
MPAGALVAVCLVLAALVGIGVGAVWGQSGRDGAAPTARPTSTSAAPSSAPASPSGGATSSEPTPETSTPTPPPVTGSIPPAPATTTTSADGWRLGSWRITNTGGLLGVDTTARNTSTGTRSAELILYVYVDGVPIATTTTTVTDVPAGETVPVQFTGTDPWKPGQKVLLLQVA